MSALPLESGHCPPTTLAACYLAVVKPASIGNVILVTKTAPRAATAATRRIPFPCFVVCASKAGPR
jgi:hypothetical protein